MDIRNSFSITVILLIILVFCSAVAVVYVRQANRLLFIAIDGLSNKKAELYYQRSQLILENETMSHLSRVDEIARNNLAMVKPNKIQIIN